MNKKIKVLTIAILVPIMLTACSNSKTVQEPVTKTNFLLDTVIQITAYGPNASESIEEVFDRISDIEKKMNSKGEKSEIINVNNAAGSNFVKVSPDTFFVVEQGIIYSDLSKGRFDITVGPLVNLWDIGSDNPRVPPEEQISLSLQHINYKDILLDKENYSIMLKKPGMAIDLGAIAKGYAADEAVRILKEKGINTAIVDLGGNVYALGKKPNGKPWRVGIQNPDSNRGQVFATVMVSDKTLVTSGPYERFFEKDGKRYHHILDPHSGYPVENGLVSVTIISDSSIEADSLSTAVFAMGLENGMELVKSLPQVEAVFVTADFKVYTSPGIKKYNFQINDDKYKLSSLYKK